MGNNQTIKRQRRSRRLTLVIALVMAVLSAGGLLAVAYAQSGASAFNLNSPAAFPVDI